MSVLDYTKLYYRQAYSAYCFLADLPEATAKFQADRKLLWALNDGPTADAAQRVALELTDNVAALEVDDHRHSPAAVQTINLQRDNATQGLNQLARLFGAYPANTVIGTLDNWDWR
ncbi:hypothetical protein D1831_08625 [Lactiplantibacillus garii]|uniref:Uncharacterized protein n=1 Tax=Lactiplantibacillus garii TaxID=2306423 RepID=A0A3R8QQQ9_9LACO|nr:hypothetical protein [Lactiplantibacillus garii]RRK10216.1 hypothetical protein D1831_08625 [Lactiplantibacillus garii]